MKLGEIIDFLSNYDGEPVRIMEVCGTHTSTIVRNGIRDMLSDKIRLISGPGCPVCVTTEAYIDKLCELADNPSVTISTFGDMMKVRGKHFSLFDASARGADVRILYSPLDLIEMAQNEPDRTFIMAAVGFETTAPIYALLLDRIIEENIRNIKLLTSLKRIVPAIEFICENDNEVDAFIAPGNVSAIIGSNAYNDICLKYQKPFVVTGFSTEEVIYSIYLLVKLKEENKSCVYNIYINAVKTNGNVHAKEMLENYFEVCDCCWRSIGEIKNSGLFLKPEFEKFNAGEYPDEISAENSGCSCGEVILGKIQPTQCKLFGKICTPTNPIGPCMVSSEGSCAIHYCG